MDAYRATETTFSDSMYDLRNRIITPIGEQDIRPAQAGDLEEIIITPQMIRERTSQLADQISQEYPEGVVVIGILSGALPFYSALTTAMSVPVFYGFHRMSSYDGTESSGEVKSFALIDLATLKDRDVLVVEDIVDTGLTMSKYLEEVRVYGPRSIKIASFLDKPGRRKNDLTPDFIGYTVKPTDFVIGFGLDYEERFRNLPFVATLSKSGQQRINEEERQRRLDTNLSRSI
jgi:hypoxanthine phosphoribosyltransferase